ncbi:MULTISPECIES: hypothetical protein [Mycobacterium]|uniref:hypothetical protein n=1 Tax=Mycobacterium TaxID=1763 RepID=UPI00197C26CA|nr:MULTISPECIES: hypothetical protein [Mycobacterium]MDM4142133.1 hypothetical protein [Mycobacterium sp. FLAC0960]
MAHIVVGGDIARSADLRAAAEPTAGVAVTSRNGRRMVGEELTAKELEVLRLPPTGYRNLKSVRGCMFRSIP